MGLPQRLAAEGITKNMEKGKGSQPQPQPQPWLQKHLLLPFLLLIFFSTAWSSSLPHEPRNQHFVLVHGACFGAWSWYKLTTLLKSSGHNVTALDMAASGIDPTRAESLSSLTDYYKPLFSFMEALPSEEKIVLVGHSLGGLGISMAMEKFPEKISVAIFVTAAMPGPLFKYSSTEEQKRMLGMYTGSMASPKLFLFSEKDLATKLYPLSPPEDVALASALVRPQVIPDLVETMKELKLSREKYGSVKRAFVISEKDEMTPVIMVWAMLVLNKPDLVAEIKGSDHMVMASKPFDLAEQLQIIARRLHLHLSSSDM